MSYIDGMLAAVPTARKDDYLAYARETGAIFKEFGATGVFENWGDDLPHGKLTDFYRAVQAGPDETVVFSWLTWPDKAARDAAWARVMEDPRLAGMAMPFDGKRMIFGGFEVLLDG